MRTLTPFISALSLTLCLALTSCGGGGGDGGGEPMPSTLVTANAGADASADENTSVSLTGDVADPSGALAGVKWTQVSGPTATIQNDTSALASFTAPDVPFGAGTALVFRLTAADTSGGVSTDDVAITVNSKERLVLRDNSSQYHVVDVQTGVSTPVNMPIPAGRTLSVVGVSPDGKHLAYVADQDTFDVQELYLTNLSTNTNVKGSVAIVSGGRVYSFRWTDTSSHVVYQADADTVGKIEIYSAQADGSAKAKVNHPLPGGATVNWYVPSPDGTKVAYRSDITSTFRQYVSPIGGGPSVDISGAVPAGVDVQALNTDWSPDSTKVIFRAEDLHLYMGTADGSTSLPVDQANSDARSFGWSPDSSRIAYAGDDDTTGLQELFVWSPAGSLKVSGTLMSGGIGAAQWSPDGLRIAYRASQDFSDRDNLYVAMTDGTGSIRCSNVVSGGDLSRPTWAPDGSRVAYLGSESGNPNFQTLHTVLPDGTGHVDVSSPGAVHFDDEFFWTPDSSRLVYDSVVLGGNTMTYSGSATATAPILLNGPLVANTDASLSRFTGTSPDGSAVVYFAQEAGSPTLDIHVVDLMGTTRVRVFGASAGSPRWSTP